MKQHFLAKSHGRKSSDREGPALKFRARRRQAMQEQAKQALTVVVIIQLAPN